MQHRWWLSVPHVIRHSFYSTSTFIALTAMAVGVSRFLKVASPQIESKFVIYVLVFLEYAMIVTDAILGLIRLVEPIIEKLKKVAR